MTKDSPLGKKTEYLTEYTPDLLFPIPRAGKRAELGVCDRLPFYGADIWNAYELSWLNANGKPVVALGEFIFPATSPYLIESKSLKLYLNSFNNSKFVSIEEVQQRLQDDLTKTSGEKVACKISFLGDGEQRTLFEPSGECIDDLDIDCDIYSYAPHLLRLDEDGLMVKEILYTNLLKSNCPVTGQPDWATLQIAYSGRKIEHQSLLQYLISFRNHQEFHEQCVERIFIDIQQKCAPSTLTIFAQYTRRGGLDINPYRSTDSYLPSFQRQVRQ